MRDIYQCNVPPFGNFKNWRNIVQVYVLKRDIVDPPKAPQMFQATHQN